MKNVVRGPPFTFEREASEGKRGTKHGVLPHYDSQAQRRRRAY